MLNTETENRIIEAAEKLFYRKGKAGTSMQDIADQAGINRTLLNYYFRSKDMLFETVFRKAMRIFVPNLVAMLNSDVTFSEYVTQMVNLIIDSMLENPRIPIFVLQELSSNPERMPQIIMEMGSDPGKIMNKFENEKVAMGFGDLDPRQVMINILSLCIFPFAARPVVTNILYGGDEEAFVEAMKERKIYLPKMIMETLKRNSLP
ncbi:MAG: TetR/AcrR family transcriptional regulator [Bacteroidales bacterium]|nr:TetR/AcrR family transcriptional regulator [Bacteroidales bacterium]